MRILDLFCGAGGAAMGLRRAFPDAEIIGVDTSPQPRYPFQFRQADAMTFSLDSYDLVWASPPCQAYTNQGKLNGHPKLIDPIRQRLLDSGMPYIIENVVGAPLLNPVVLCGSMFGLNVRRHRKFETSFAIALDKTCNHKGQEVRAYYGAWGREAFRAKKPGNKDTLRGTVERALMDMGIDWMTWAELTQAIPPSYAEYIARQFAACSSHPNSTNSI